MAKQEKRVVVNEKYFELLRRKADLLDEGFDHSDRFDQFVVSKDMFKTYEKIDNAWQKLDLGWGDGFEPYVEPKPVGTIVMKKKKLVSGFDSPSSRKKK